ncbi:septation ring formation regulator [Gracilibacillus halotolerans]|uniref:Septation ring formation regulator EzrA n=1 Tax=Gracilibacillus halotolerans TaxID=74386 RepID=A0A841RT43_9BACI|nr:septation ring formation regulator EzrA [Gracilibacillus halotolerans]MBB6513718.1 septation ring formation regulator [Gracilibacillus halotolerans]
MVEVIIGIILIIVVLLIIGLILRKRVYDQVDQMEEWKMDIMNRNVTTQLSKVKNLKLSGQTQEKFESWKDSWDVIITVDLPDIEEYLLDAEEAADRFRFNTAKKDIQHVENTLQSIEDNIKTMFEELDHLLDSEKYAKSKMEELVPRISELKKYLLQNRTLYGSAEVVFETELSKANKDLEAIGEEIDEGNYLEAQEQMEAIEKQTNEIEEKIETFPEIYKQCRQTIPKQLNDLAIAMKEMQEDGFKVEIFGFDKEIRQYKQLLKDGMRELENGEFKAISESLTQIEERIEEMFQLMEHETKAKSIVESQLPKTFHKLEELDDNIIKTNAEIELLQKTYYMEKTDLELFLSLEKWLEKLKNQYEQSREAYEEQSVTYGELKEKLETLSEESNKLEDSHQDFDQQVKELRKDELEAKDKIVSLKRQLTESKKKLEKSNIPGVPSFILNALDEATTRCETVLQQLQKQPLDMGKIRHSMEEANKSVTSFTKETNLILDQARLVELVIQYGNRFRRSHPELSKELLEAEQLFREFKYETALEHAVRSVEKIEPNVMRKVEEMEQLYEQYTVNS